MELSRFKRTLRQVLVLPIVAGLLLAAVLVWQVNGSDRTVRSIEKSDRTIALATRIEKLVVDEETGLRGYQVTSDKAFLDPYYKASVPFAQNVHELQGLISPGQRPIFDEFLAEHQIWLQGFAEPIVASVASGNRANDEDLNLTGRARVDRMRSLLSSIEADSERTRTAYTTAWEAQSDELILVLYIATLALGVVVGLFTHDRLDAVSAAFRRSLDMQKRRAEELFESEQNLRTTLASIGDGVITCDTQGKIQTMNPVAQALTGWQEADACGKQLTDVFRIINESTRQPVENPVEKVFRSGQIVGLANHTVLIRRDGSELSIDDSAAPIRKQTGDLIGIVMVFRDVTMERRTRAALLANEKLAVAGRLAATIAHEIHNPLDSVANLLYLLQHDPKDSESKHFLEIAQTELARVTQISRAMLSLYRESRSPMPINLREMLQDLLLLMEGRIHSIGVNMSADLPDGITVDGYPAELRQVFTNIITNAAEAAGAGGNVVVRVVPQSAGTGSAGHNVEAGAIVEVVDDGPGVSEEVKERLFQPFFTTKGENGTGLGLWVSQGIIRKHGGTLELLSENGSHGHGTTARIFLAQKPVIQPPS